MGIMLGWYSINIWDFSSALYSGFPREHGHCIQTHKPTDNQSPHLLAQQQQNQAKPFMSVDVEAVTQMSYIFVESVLSVQVR